MSIKDGLIILLPVVDAVRLFGEKLNLSCIAEEPKAHLCPRLTLNLSKKRDVGTPSVNNTTTRDAAPESLQFGRAFSRILQAV